MRNVWRPTSTKASGAASRWTSRCETARWELFMGVSEVSAWPFVVLSVNGAPRPLVAGANEIGEAADPSRLGFGEQHKRLRLLVEARRPTVIGVHGELRRGHRLFLERVSKSSSNRRPYSGAPSPTSSSTAERSRSSSAASSPPRWPSRSVNRPKALRPSSRTASRWRSRTEPKMCS